MSARIIADVLPAVVNTPEGQKSQVRLVLTSEPSYVLLYESKSGRAHLAYSGPYTALQRALKANEHDRVVFEDDSEWTFWKGKGCGCGAPIRKATVSKDVKELTQQT